MTKTELEGKCRLKKGELINSNLGFIDILKIENDIVTLGVLATGDVFTESVESVMSKLKNPK